MSVPSAVCVFCGASAGRRPEYADAARQLGSLIARAGSTLVYGGGRVGLMGCVADGALESGGRVVGVITEQLMDRELGHRGIAELLVVPTMHERKAMMADRAEGFVSLPGGLGTFDELFEILSWAQLGIHQKPVGLLNTLGFYDPLLAMVEHAATDGFLRMNHREEISVDAD
ncbi:MAG: TIGR00730 family Rossman fold protein, partial [Phycisphaerales bacterium]